MKHSIRLHKLYLLLIPFALIFYSFNKETISLEKKTSWKAGEEIKLGVAYESGNYRLQFQDADGNLVIYKMDDCSVEFTTWTNNQAAYSCILQDDGNLVIYGKGENGQPKALWNTQTNGNPGAWLQFNPDGNLVVYINPNNPIAKWDMFSARQARGGALGPFPSINGQPCYVPQPIPKPQGASGVFPCKTQYQKCGSNLYCPDNQICCLCQKTGKETLLTRLTQSSTAYECQSRVICTP